MSSLLCPAPVARADDYPFAGNPPITPRWAYEHWVWEDTTNTQASTTQLVADYQSRNIPVGAVIIDSPWSTAYMNFAFNGSRYPDPQAMITGFRNQGIQVVCWMVGMINQSSPAAEVPSVTHPSFDFARSQNYQVRNPANSDPATNDIFSYWKGSGLAIDFTNPAAVGWFMGNGNADLIAMGVRGFKVDESNAYLPGSITSSPGSVYGGAAITKDQYTAHYHAKVSDWIRDQTSATGNDGLVISRPYSWQGQPAGYHCPVSKLTAGWCGDYGGDFAGFAEQVRDIYISAGAGYSALGFEVGGYFGASATRDSLLRQAQFAALVPVMENGGSNGGLTNHVPWYWDNLNGTTTTVPIYRYYATLHRNLAPFQFHCGVVANLTGTPAITQTDISVYRHVLGDTFLTRAVMSGDNASVVMKFPAGRWIDWWSQDKVYAGTGQATITSSIDKAPIYVKAGSIVPVNVDNDVTGLGDAGSVGKDTVLVYPYGTTSLTYHRALGDGIVYEDAVITATEGASGSLQVASPASRTWLFKVKCFAAPSSVDGADSWSYDAAGKTLTVEKTGSAFTILVGGLTGYSSITPIATAATTGTDTWTGGGADANWSSSGNWSGTNAPPVTGDTLAFAGGSRLANTNDLASLTSYAGLSFSSGAGAFTLSGNSIVVAGDIVNSSSSNQTLALAVVSDAGAARQFTASASTGKLTFAGGLTRDNTTPVGRALTFAQGSTSATGAATYEFSGVVNISNPVPVANDGSTSGLVQRNATIVNLLSGANVTLTGGYWSVGQNNQTGTTVQPAILNIRSGARLALGADTNFNLGHNFNAGGNTNPNQGILNLEGGEVVAALDPANVTGARYIRLGLNGSTSATSVANGTINLNAGTFVTSRTFVRGGTLANTGTAHTQQSGQLVFNGGTLATDGVNDVAEWFQSVAGGTGNQFLPLNAVTLAAGGGAFDTAGRNAATAFPLSGVGGLVKTGVGALTLSGATTYTGTTRVAVGTLVVNGSLAAGGGAVTVESGARLAGTGVCGGPVEIAADGTLAPGLDGSGAFTLSGSLTLNPGSILAVGVGASSGSVTLQGALNVTGTTTVDVEALAGFGPGTYALISGPLSLSASNFALGVVPPDYDYALAAASGVLSLTVSEPPPLTPQESWRLSNFGSADNSGEGADSADPDGDGRNNLCEYMHGTDPKSGEASPSQVRVENGRLVLAFTRNSAATDLTVTVQGTDALDGAWSDLARSVGGAAFEILVPGVQVTEEGTAPIRPVKVVDVYQVDASQHPRRFLRVVGVVE